MCSPCKQITSREKDLLPSTFQTVLDNRTTNVTTVQLSPLNEQDVVDYVSVTLYRPQEYVLPLAIVCLEKTNGYEKETPSLGQLISWLTIAGTRSTCVKC